MALDAFLKKLKIDPHALKVSLKKRNFILESGWAEYGNYYYKEIAIHSANDLLSNQIKYDKSSGFGGCQISRFIDSLVWLLAEMGNLITIKDALINSRNSIRTLGCVAALDKFRETHLSSGIDLRSMGILEQIFLAPRNTEISSVKSSQQHSPPINQLIQDCTSAYKSLAEAIGIIDNESEQEIDVENIYKIIKTIIDSIEQFIPIIRSFLYDFWSCCPNKIDDAVPCGSSADDNKEIGRYGEIRRFDFAHKNHYELPIYRLITDHKQTEIISGSRFTTLIGQGARLERALINFMIDHAVEHEYIEVSPPYLAKMGAFFGVGQWPKFEGELYRTQEESSKFIPKTEDENERYYREASPALITTGEVPLTNMVSDMIINGDELPLRYVTCTPCFRREAGSGGRDLRGLIRQHQFTKVEIVSITDEDGSANEHERMRRVVEGVLKKLCLPLRTVLLCSGDMGFAAAATYDIEVWMPGQACYREISSISNCRDFQAIRMNARYKDKATKKNKYVHTLNGSALAVGRTMAAILENYQNADGSVDVPDVLVDYMKGIKRLS